MRQQPLRIKRTTKMDGLKRDPAFLYCLLFFLLCSVHLLARNPNEEEVTKSQFPDGFFFGASTAAYQIEGAPLEDGKGLSNWDVFTHIPGKIKNNENGDIADDHYHRFLEDIDLMHSLGINSYRFSISWTRILPRGIFGEVNKDGIMFYDKIIDNLLLRGIEPFVAIHHHDVPQELEDRYDSWLSSLMQKDYVHFAQVCFESFGDRVKNWVTINEPHLFAEMAYVRGTYPPGRCSSPFGNCSVGNSDREPITALHNMILSHAKAVHLYRNHFQAKQGGRIGIIVHVFMYEPLRDIELDREAVKRALAFAGPWVLDPVVFGDYPPEMLQILGSQMPSFSSEEKRLVKGSIDFIGINHYGSLYAQDCIHTACDLAGDRPIRGLLTTTAIRDGIPIGNRTGYPSFFVVPKGMEKIIDYMKTRYNNIPMFVTENGYSSPNQNGELLLEDFDRIEYHRSYLAALLKAMRKGADVRGYFVWSLLDNFEWASGYGPKFGLYHVDRKTLERLPRLSATWYKTFIADRGSADGHSYKEFDKTSRIAASTEVVAADSEAMTGIM